MYRFYQGLQVAVENNTKTTPPVMATHSPTATQARPCVEPVSCTGDRESDPTPDVANLFS